ncbi:hypothetical protein [Marinoscillum sp.]|uniref:hypothetical protein n=1 Tax=Marinoscillum sp. TaxID=2024838 RepID=UPI003BAB6CC5
MPTIIKYLIVYALSAVKIIFGPTLGLAYDFSIAETTLLSLLGMMTTVYLFSYFGHEIKAFSDRIFRRKKRRIFTRKNRQFVKIWRRYGVPGVAFFTPILLSPPGGAILANAFGGKKTDIIKWMWIFGSFWSLVLTLMVKYASWLLKDLGVI